VQALVEEDIHSLDDSMVELVVASAKDLAESVGEGLDHAEVQEHMDNIPEEGDLDPVGGQSDIEVTCNEERLTY
jgi:hypothetical protein